jgi:hypothetical protein
LEAADDLEAVRAIGAIVHLWRGRGSGGRGEMVWVGLAGGRDRPGAC